ncbi:MAG: TRAP transporter small permease [Firmicutes bacterium]|nr:TRAP transporter small permease [Bacillota bacterium]
MVKRLTWFFNNLEEVLCGALLCWIMTLLMLQVICRYFLGISIAWAEEVSRFSFLYMVYLGASLGAQKGIHIRVTAHIALLPKKVQSLLLVLTDVIWIVFSIVVVVKGVHLIQDMGQRPMVSGALMLDMRYVYVALPIAFLLMIVRIVQRWYLRFRGGDQGTLGGVS